MLRFDKCLQIAKLPLPENAVVLQPAVDRFQGRRVELVETMASAPRLTHEVGLSKHAEMLGNRGTGDGEGASDLTGRLAALTQ